jgi:hypothetical protein
MNDCDAIDTLVTPYIDGELGDGERGIVSSHLRRCLACRERVEAESTVRQLVRSGAAASRAAGREPDWRPRVYGLGRPAPRIPRTALLTGAAAAAIAAILFLVRPTPIAAVGMIGDSQCGERHRYTSSDGENRLCTLNCVAHGAEFVLVADNTVYTIRNQDFPELAAFADVRVAISGTVGGQAITISRIAPAR